jgi:hypothetical protein
MKKYRKAFKEKAEKLEVQYCMNPFHYLKIHLVGTHFLFFYSIWTNNQKVLLAMLFCLQDPLFWPGMLSAQLVGRLLPEIESSDNIRNLLR